MKGIYDLLQPVTVTTRNCFVRVVFPPFNYKWMTKQSSLIATIRQYPQELLLLFGGIHISDVDDREILRCIKHNKVYAGSDGSLKDGKGGHTFCIIDNTFSRTIWGYAPTVGSTREMSSLQAEHGGALGILQYCICTIHLIPGSLSFRIDCPD